MAKPKPPLKGGAAKKFYWEGGIKQYFRNDTKKNQKKKVGRPKKRTFPNRKKSTDASSPPTSLKSPPKQIASTSGKALNVTATAPRKPQDSADDDIEPVPPLASQILEDSDDEESVSASPAPAQPKGTQIFTGILQLAGALSIFSLAYGDAGYFSRAP